MCGRTDKEGMPGARQEEINCPLEQIIYHEYIIFNKKPIKTKESVDIIIYSIIMKLNRKVTELDDKNSNGIPNDPVKNYVRRV